MSIRGNYWRIGTGSILRQTTILKGEPLGGDDSLSRILLMKYKDFFL